MLIANGKVTSDRKPHLATRKSGNTPRLSRYSCRACSRSSGVGAVLYFRIQLTPHQRIQFLLQPLANFFGTVIIIGQMVFHQSHKKLIGNLYTFHTHSPVTVVTIVTVFYTPPKSPSRPSPSSRFLRNRSQLICPFALHGYGSLHTGISYSNRRYPDQYQAFGQGVRQHIDLQEETSSVGLPLQGSFTNFAIASSTGSGGSLYSWFSMRSRFQIWV